MITGGSLVLPDVGVFFVGIVVGTWFCDVLL
jgi:hypothetical protein